MTESFIIAINAVIPFIIYLSAGWYAKRKKIVSGIFFSDLNHMLYRLIYRFVTFTSIYNSDKSAFPSSRLVIFSVISVFSLIVLLIIIVPRLISENSKRGVMIQALYRSNFIFFATPLIISIYGAASGAAVGIIVPIVVSIYNVTAVIILEYYSQADKTGSGAGDSASGVSFALSMAGGIIKNPYLQGTLLGTFFFAAGIRLPSGIETAVQAFSSLATPMALFILGGTIEINGIIRNRRYLVPGLFVKLVLLPLIMTAAAYAAGLRNMELFIIMTMFGTPTAIASYAMAENMGGDSELAGQFVFLSTIISVATLFVWIFILNMLGLLL